MNISAVGKSPIETAPFSVTGDEAKARQLQTTAEKSPELRKAFDSFIGESFYGQLLGAMRKSTGKPAYFHGGQAEEIFRGQLDQTLATEMTKANAGDLTGGMFELFNLQRP